MKVTQRLYDWGAMRSFGKPQGLAGRYADRVMRRKGRPSSEWVVSLLDIEPEDHVLEIGFGPGWGIKSAAEAAHSGLVTGIDHSPLMVKRATRRNQDAIAEGSVELVGESVMSLPFEDRSFEKAFSINSIQFWPDANDGMREVFRVMKDGGRVALGFNPYAGESSSPLSEYLESAGFKDVRMEKSDVAHCALGKK